MEKKVTKKNHKKDPFYERELEKYPNPIPSREYIQEYLEQIGRPVSYKHLLKEFGLKKQAAQEALWRRLQAMERDGQLMCNRRGSYALVKELDLIRGYIIGHKDGFGFLVPDDKSGDIFLPPYQMRSLFPGDIVLVRVLKGRLTMRGKREGVVVEVLQRNTQQIVGRYYKERNIAFVTPDNKDIQQDIVIPPGDEGPAENGQYVVVEITQQPTSRRQATGKIIELLGEELTPGLEIEVAIRAHNLPHHWPSEVQADIASYQPEVSESDKQNRQDLRHLPLVTIDGEDAKDFDDAVYCERTKNSWKLYVAIADVSHYVTPDTALDKEASKRGNSVYFPGRVIPMLPEILSNELCSLKPNVDRLCMVCEMDINHKGELINYQFYDAVMCSRARLTYTEVAATLEGRKKTKNALWPQLEALHDLYQILHKQRKQRGALDFDTVETRIIFGKNKKIKEIIPTQRNVAHKIIEECMLAANVATARFLAQHKLPALYRIHEGPNPEKLQALRDFLKSVGLRLGGGDEPQPIDYAKLIDKIQTRQDFMLIQTVLLRSLMQAVYSPINKGHFGLAYEFYTHFTSPIRRYPDLLVHRALKHLIEKDKRSKFNYDIAKMMDFGDHCSMTERRGDEATRDAVNWLKCYYMKDKLGQVFEGIISGVTGFGIFVQLTSIYVEGLVHITALRNDYYQFDPIKHSLQGKRTGTIYRLGDSIKVLVARVNLDEKMIDFELEAAEPSSKKSKRRRRK